MAERFISTAYGPPWNAMNGTGVTAAGVDLRDGKPYYGVAVDPSVIPLGTKLTIWPNPFKYRGTFEAFDTGGAIKGNRIDFYDWRGRSRQLLWGRRTVEVERGAVDAGLPGVPSLPGFPNPFKTPSLPSLPNPLQGLDAVASALRNISEALLGLFKLQLELFTKIADPQTWIDALKVSGGLILIYMGLKRLLTITT